MISNKQLTVSILSIVLAIFASSLLIKTLFDHLDLPEVFIDTDGNCVKVINYKNGDGYVCQDKDVILRKYITVHVM